MEKINGKYIKEHGTFDIKKYHIWNKNSLSKCKIKLDVTEKDKWTWKHNNR